MIEEFSNFIDLAPTIIRKRLIIECIYNGIIDQEKIKDYMIKLSDVMNMTIVSMPIINYEEEYGFSAYMCWKESGMHVYTWSKTDLRPNFISIDIYTCKDFLIRDVINTTKDIFKKNILKITWRE